MKAGPGPEVTEAEELDRVVPVVTGLVARFDTPVSVDTWRAAVARAVLRRGRGGGQRHQRPRRPRLPPAAAEHSATVVVTHIRLAPRVADPDPHYDDVVADVAAFLTERAARRRRRRLAPERIVLDAGLDLGKTAEQSLTLLRASRPGRAGLPAAALGVQQDVPGRGPDLELAERREASLARRPRHRLGLPDRARARRQGPAGPVTCWPPSPRPREQGRRRLAIW